MGLRDEVNTMLQMDGQENIACLLIATDISKDDVKERIHAFGGSHWSEPFVDAEGNLGVFAADIDNSLKLLESMGRNIVETYAGHSSMIVAVGHHSGTAFGMRSAYEKALFALRWKRYQGGADLFIIRICRRVTHWPV